jgi:hypothetical protein
VADDQGRDEEGVRDEEPDGGLGWFNYVVL